MTPLCEVHHVSLIAEWAADNHTEKTMREGHRWFITQAFEKLSVRGSKCFHGELVALQSEIILLMRL